MLLKTHNAACEERKKKAVLPIFLFNKKPTQDCAVIN